MPPTRRGDGRLDARAQGQPLLVYQHYIVRVNPGHVGLLFLPTPHDVAPLHLVFYGDEDLVPQAAHAVPCVHMDDLDGPPRRRRRLADLAVVHHVYSRHFPQFTQTSTGTERKGTGICKICEATRSALKG